jgi:signal transduction histidine kinase/CheY-like chemotaxis protein
MRSLKKLILSIENVHVSYVASVMASVILVFVLQGYISNSILYGWLSINLFAILLRIWLAKIQLYPHDKLKNKHYKKILFLSGITFSGFVWASSSCFLFPEDDIVRQLFLVFILMGMTAGAPAVSAPNTTAFLCFSQPILHILSLRFIYQGEAIFYIMAVLTQLHNSMLIITSINFSQIDRRLRIAKEEAESASLAKSEFLANISHEVRTPMNAIVGINHLLGQTSLSIKQRDYVDKSLVASKSLLNTIENILDYSKIETKRNKINQTNFHLQMMLKTVTTLAELDAKKKKIHFSYLIADEVADYLMGDPVKLTQILNNLVDNALKFTEEGEVKLTIKQIDQCDDKVLIHFSVSDTGIGIAKKDYKKIFQSFSQVNTSHSRQYKGSGLGLCISQQLAYLMGSFIEVESSLGKGSTFHFSVWFHQCEDKEDFKTLLSELPTQLVPNITSPLLKQSKILLIEDDRLSQIITHDLLKLLGQNVVVAGSAKLAFGYLKDNQPDLILLDIQMPQIDGYQAIKNLRLMDSCKKLPIICLTAHTSIDEKERVLQAGMDDYLIKPVDLDQLRRVLMKWLPQIGNRVNESSWSTINSQKIDMDANSLTVGQASKIEISLKLQHTVEQLLSKKSAIVFFETAKESLNTSKNELLSSLAVKDWKIARLNAHRLRGTVDFYASASLIQCLCDIDKGIISDQNVDETIQLLETEFAWVNDALEEKLISMSAK